MFSKIFTFFKWNHHYKRWMERIKRYEEREKLVNLLCDNYEDFMDITAEYIPEFKKIYKKIYPRRLKVMDAKRLPTTAVMRKSFQDFA